MSALITTTDIPNGAVYGVPQKAYTVEGVAGQDFTAALAAAAFREATAIEAATASYADVVRTRTRKCEDLGEVLAALAKAVASMPTNSQKSDDKSEKSAEIYKAQTIAKQYGFDLQLVDVDEGNGVAAVRRDNAYRLQNDIQYALDTEDNELQQDAVALQSLVSRRDTAFSTAAKLVRKADDAAQSTIGNMVG